MNKSFYFGKLGNKIREDVAFVFRSVSSVPLRNTKPRAFLDRKRYFKDHCYVRAEGGKGGDGLVSFLKLYMNPLAGPCGGDGGNGGHVIFQASNGVKSLDSINSVIKGESGTDGRSNCMHGASGEHCLVKVPVGTLFKKNGKIVCDLSSHGAKFIGARGGAGGHGNKFFLSNNNRFPEVAEYGGEGEVNSYFMEMRIMAHVGLVGFPNAGKSTLLRAISRAHPKVAAYPFTTLNPHVGIVHYDDYVQIAVADLPGLIPGAHENRGLGISFLKHIERCVCILFVLDLSSEHPLQQLDVLKYEMEQYQEGLSTKPHAIVANKCDLSGTEEKLKLLKEECGLPVYPISAKFGNNVRSLLDHVRYLYDEYNKDIF